MVFEYNDLWNDGDLCVVFEEDGVLDLMIQVI